MAILTLQKRNREIGRIRIGQVVSGANGRTRPEKLDRFRLTSASRELLERVATLYGGDVREWRPQGGGTAAWEVITTATRIPVLVPPEPVSQWFELWSGGGCQRRCDGRRELLTDSPCLCSPDPEDRECKPTTRLNVVLRDLKGGVSGVWRLETHGYYSATELPQIADFLASARRYIEAWLVLEERVVKRDGKTHRFMVPALEVDLTPAELLAGEPERAALPAAPPAELESGEIWRHILAAVPAAWTTAQAEEDFYRRSGARPEKATADQLRRYLDWLTSRGQRMAAGPVNPASSPAVERPTGAVRSHRERHAPGATDEAPVSTEILSAPPAVRATEPESTDWDARIARCEADLDLPGIRELYKEAGQKEPENNDLCALIEYAGISIKEMLAEQAAALRTAEPDSPAETPEALAERKTRDELRAELFALLGKGGVKGEEMRPERLRICSRLTVPNRVPEITSTNDLGALEVAQVIVALRRYDREGTLTETLAALSGTGG